MTLQFETERGSTWEAKFSDPITIDTLWLNGSLVKPTGRFEEIVWKAFDSRFDLGREFADYAFEKQFN